MNCRGYNGILEGALNLKQFIRDIPDFPKPGILFKDITPLLQAPEAFTQVIDRLAQHYQSRSIDAVLGIEARGFIFGAALAYRLAKPLVLVRKPGKLPAETKSVTYALEYGSDTLEMHRDGVAPGHNVVIVDDVLATGGTVSAACRLVEESGGKVASIALVVELRFLGGRDKLQGYDIHALVEY
jgi:adenine phosphoribosyltransferase